MSRKTRAILCITIVLGGLFTMKALASLKEPPKAAAPAEATLTVDVLEAQPQHVQTTLTGFGEVSSVNSVGLAPEVSGRVVDIHPGLEEGSIIQKDEVLFRLDTDTLLLEKTTAEARLITLKRNRDLLKKEYLRTKRLFETVKTGSLTNVESAEQNYNSAQDSVDQVEHTLALAELNLKRSTLTAPFTGRVKGVTLEMNQYVSAGATVVTLADDSMLEIAVPLLGTEAASLLKFADNTAKGSWFGKLAPQICEVSWNQGTTKATGTLDRIIRYDAASRTVYVAVRITPEDQPGFPVTDGMFCKVTIPGRTLTDVVPLPSSAVNENGTVYIAQNNRLETVPIEIAYSRGETSCITAIAPGTLIITSRLTAPVENTKLTVAAPLELALGGTP